MDLDLLPLDRVRPSGLFTFAEAISLGRQRREVSNWARDGVVERVEPGVFVLAERWQTSERRLVLRSHARSLRLGRSVVLSHTAAAALHGLPLMSHSRAPGHRVHLIRDSPGPGESTARHTLHQRYGADQCGPPIEGIAVVRPVLAAFGVAEIAGLVAGVMALDAALHRGLTTTEEAQSWLSRLGRRPGTAVVRRMVAAADGLSESPLESQARIVVHALGYRLCLQVVLRTPGGEFVARVDGLIAELGVVVEVDGKGKYVGLAGTGSVSAVVSEKHRESAIRDLGYGVVRLDHASLEDPDQIDVRIQDAARRAHPSVRRPGAASA